MKYITLDCAQMTGPEQVHDLFARALDFPASYGRNLDALYDLLSTCPPTQLTLIHAAALKKLLRYGDNLLLAVEDAARDNPALELNLCE